METNTGEITQPIAINVLHNVLLVCRTIVLC
jgi:hypothetical protein